MEELGDLPRVPPGRPAYRAVRLLTLLGCPPFLPLVPFHGWLRAAGASRWALGARRRGLGGGKRVPGASRFRQSVRVGALTEALAEACLSHIVKVARLGTAFANGARRTGTAWGEGYRRHDLVPGAMQMGWVEVATRPAAIAANGVGRSARAHVHDDERRGGAAVRPVREGQSEGHLVASAVAFEREAPTMAKSKTTVNKKPAAEVARATA